MGENILLNIRDYLKTKSLMVCLESIIDETIFSGSVNKGGELQSEL